MTQNLQRGYGLRWGKCEQTEQMKELLKKRIKQEDIVIMPKELTSSTIERQNVLNNPYAVTEIQKAVDLQCIFFEDRNWLNKEQIASFFEVTPRTIDNYLNKYESELRHNGYEVLQGIRLKKLKKDIIEQFGDEMDFFTKTTTLGIFDFRAFLNIAMLLTESERARVLRQTILDIVIDTINQRTGNSTKYINQRDGDFILAYFQEENYWKIQYVGISDILRKMVNPNGRSFPAAWRGSFKL